MKPNCATAIVTITAYVALLTATSPTLLAADADYRNPDGYPALRIKAVKSPQHGSLQIDLEIAAKGKTPIALSQKQFSIHISTDQAPFRFISPALFPTNAPQVFTIDPKAPTTITVDTSTNRLGSGERLSDLPAGKYTVRVYVNSERAKEFDYQWRGQTYSDDYSLVVK
jgi:hypothetical protein